MGNCYGCYAYTDKEIYPWVIVPPRPYWTASVAVSTRALWADDVDKNLLEFMQSVYPTTLSLFQNPRLVNGLKKAIQVLIYRYRYPCVPSLCISSPDARCDDLKLYMRIDSIASVYELWMV